MKFSFVIPVHNSSEYLADCVDSILKLTCHDTEIILVDDGSTDGSGDLCDAFERDNRNVLVLHQQNQGVSSARNLGLQRSTGEYTVFIDSDDTVDPDRMEKCLDILSNDGEIDMLVYGMSFDFFTKGKLYRNIIMLPPFEGKKSIDKCKESLNQLFISNCLSSCCNKIIRRKIITENSIYQDSEMIILEDLEFSTRLLSKCKKVFFSALPVYHYRQSEDESNAGKRLLTINNISDVVEKITSAFSTLGCESDGILHDVYKMLAYEKIKKADRKEIAMICENYKKWIDLKTVKPDELLYEGNVKKIILRRFYSCTRHKIANSVKSIFGDHIK